MIFGRDRVQEDLDKIRHANLPGSKNNEENFVEEHNFKSYSEGKITLEKSDLIAMIIAAFSVIIPYIAAFITIMGIVIFLMYKFYS